MPKKVLIVEDAADIRNALKMLIEYEGYEVLTASNGQEGYLLAQAHTPDLILMDLAMPGKDGIEATRLIRSDPKTSEIPVICITSYFGVYDAEAMSVCGSEVYSKSSFMDNFEAILKKYLET